MPDFDPNRSESNKIHDLLILCNNIASYTCGILIACHYFFFPHWPCYFTSFYPGQDVHVTYLILNGVQYFYTIQFVWTILTNQSTFLMTYGWFMIQISNEYFCFSDKTREELITFREQKYRGRQKIMSNFRTSDVFPLKYRQFQILHLQFNEVYSSAIMPMQTVVTFLAVFCNFSLVRHKGKLTTSNVVILWIWTAGATGFWLIVLFYCGSMYNQSARVLLIIRNNDWGSKRKNTMMKKFVRSCSPISYGYGKMYVIRMISTFKFITNVTRGTFKVLLTVK